MSIISYSPWIFIVQWCGSLMLGTKSGCWSRTLNSVVVPHLVIPARSTAGRQWSVTWPPEELMLYRISRREDVGFDLCSQQGDRKLGRNSIDSWKRLRIWYIYIYIGVMTSSLAHVYLYILNIFILNTLFAVLIFSIVVVFALSIHSPFMFYLNKIINQ